jgi:CRISPR-associated endoribonuclease Cas6
MQFQLTLQATQPQSRIPFNYSYLLTGWLYRVLAGADAQYATFLHERGYQTTARGTGRPKTFRLFCFSDLRMQDYEVRPREGCFLLRSPGIEWTLSFYVDRAAEAFIRGLFQDQRVVLSNRWMTTELTIEQVQTIPVAVHTDEVHVRTRSPVVVAQKDAAGMDQYLSPADPVFGQLLLLNLVDKYRSAHPDGAAVRPEGLEFRLLSDPSRIRSRLIAIKEGSPQETKVRGYYGFDFTLRGPAEVLEVGLLAGVGRYNGEGFGCVALSKISHHD